MGAVTYGVGAIGIRTAYSFIPEFISTLPDERLKIDDFASKLSDFFLNQWNIANKERPFPKNAAMTFIIAGFNDGEPYGRVYQFVIPRQPKPQERHAGGFGIAWGGQMEVINRLIKGYDFRIPTIIGKIFSPNKEQMKKLMDELNALQMSIPTPFLPLQDCVDLAIFFIRSTIEAQKLTVMTRGCGGPIDIAVIRKQQGFKYVQEKKIAGEK